MGTAGDSSGDLSGAPLETAGELVWRRLQSLAGDVSAACLETAVELLWRRLARLKRSSGDVRRACLETAAELCWRQLIQTCLKSSSGDLRTARLEISGELLWRRLGRIASQLAHTYELRSSEAPPCSELRSSEPPAFCELRSSEPPPAFQMLFPPRGRGVLISIVITSGIFLSEHCDRTDVQHCTIVGPSKITGSRE